MLFKYHAANVLTAENIGTCILFMILIYISICKDGSGSSSPISTMSRPPPSNKTNGKINGAGSDSPRMDRK